MIQFARLPKYRPYASVKLCSAGYSRSVKPSARSFSHDAPSLRQNAFRPTQNLLAEARNTPLRSYKPGDKPLFPARLQIYNSGTGKTTFISFTKLTTIFLFGASCLFLAPLFYSSPTEDNWKAVGVIAMGAVPMIIVSYITSPFVNSIFLLLPAHARRSGEVLMRYVKDLPKDAKLEFVTIRFLPWQKTTGVQLGDLRKMKSRISIANLQRLKTNKEKNSSIWQKFWQLAAEPRYRFYVDAERGGRRARVPQAWPHIWNQIGSK